MRSCRRVGSGPHGRNGLDLAGLDDVPVYGRPAPVISPLFMVGPGRREKGEHQRPDGSHAQSLPTRGRIPSHSGHEGCDPERQELDADEVAPHTETPP